jgi:hypothetical protein
MVFWRRKPNKQLDQLARAILATTGFCDLEVLEKFKLYLPDEDIRVPMTMCHLQFTWFFLYVARRIFIDKLGEPLVGKYYEELKQKVMPQAIIKITFDLPRKEQKGWLDMALKHTDPNVFKYKDCTNDFECTDLSESSSPLYKLGIHIVLNMQLPPEVKENINIQAALSQFVMNFTKQNMMQTNLVKLAKAINE